MNRGEIDMREDAMKQKDEVTESLIFNNPIKRMSEKEKLRAMQKKALLSKKHYYQADRYSAQEADNDEEGSDSADTSTI